jgi:UrcA family protein
MSRSTFLALAAALAAALATPAAAAQTGSVTIGYGDLNLASRAGRAALDQRIDGAARQLCGDVSPLELKRVALGRTCRAGVLADARAQLARVIVDDRFASLSVSRAAF